MAYGLSVSNATGSLELTKSLGYKLIARGSVTFSVTSWGGMHKISFPNQPITPLVFIKVNTLNRNVSTYGVKTNGFSLTTSEFNTSVSVDYVVVAITSTVPSQFGLITYLEDGTTVGVSSSDILVNIDGRINPGTTNEPSTLDVTLPVPPYGSRYFLLNAIRPYYERFASQANQSYQSRICIQKLSETQYRIVKMNLGTQIPGGGQVLRQITDILTGYIV